MGHLKQRFAVIGGLIGAVIVFGATGFVFIEGYSVFDAFYMSLITITTVGYMEVRPLSFAGRVFNSVFVMIGVSSMFLAMGGITQTIVELEFGRYFEKRRLRKMIQKLKGHYIICGFGRVGRGAADELRRAGQPFIVIERNEEKAERAIQAGILATVGDATRDENLRAIGIERAKGLIASLATDADNLFVILSARNLNERLIISARVLEEDSEQKLRRAGADAIFAPYTVTGARLAQAILRPHVVQFLDFATTSVGLNVNIEQVRVGASSEYVSKSPRQMQLRREVGVIVLAIRKSNGAMLFNPDPEVEISGGDHLIAMGEPAQLRRLEHLLAEVET